MAGPPDSIRVRLVSLLASALIRLLRATLRVEYRNADALERARGPEKGPFILAFWHGRLLLMRYAYPGERITVMISRHQDGEYIAATMARFGIHSTRGSTTSGGTAALREMVRRLGEGWDAAFTPDGPRGPRHVVQPGVLEAARLSGRPIVPVTFAARAGKRLSSWDGFFVPRPFSRALFLYGEPLRVPRSARGEEMDQFRHDLQDRMIVLEAEGDQLAREGGA